MERGGEWKLADGFRRRADGDVQSRTVRGVSRFRVPRGRRGRSSGDCREHQALEAGETDAGGDVVSSRRRRRGRLRAQILRRPAGMGRRRVSRARGRARAPQATRRDAGSDVTNRPRAVRRDGARSHDGGDSSRVHARVSILSTRHAHASRARRRSRSRCPGRRGGHPKDRIQRILAVIAVVFGLPRAPRGGIGD